jgi:hypothetical protein
MKDLSQFATDQHPLHPSGMRMLVICPARSALRYLLEPDGDESGAAADTGSAMHAAAAAMHRGNGVAESIGAMQASQSDYPQADLADAAAMFLNYAQDTRNRDAKIIAVEENIAFQISPAAEDPTQAPISVIGRVDQVIEVNGQLVVRDIKTSKKDAITVLHESTFQVAAYMVGIAAKLQRPVSRGLIICPRKYKADPSNSPTHWHYPWGWDDLEQILSAIRHQVARIRSGDIYHVPGDYCQWCIAKSPDLCLPKLQELKVRGR